MSAGRPAPAGRTAIRSRSSGVPADRGLDHARRVREPAVDQRQVAALHGPRLSWRGERRDGRGRSWRPRGARRCPCPAGARSRAGEGRRCPRARAAVRQEGVDQRPRPVPGARMHDEPRGLVHHQEVGVLVDDVERDGLGHELQGRAAGRRRSPARRPAGGGSPRGWPPVTRTWPPGSAPGAACARDRARWAWSKRSSRTPASAGPTSEPPARAPAGSVAGLRRRRGPAAGHCPARAPARRRGGTRPR